METWSNLPNAALINRIIDDLSNNYKPWAKEWSVFADSEIETARVAARLEVHDKKRNAIWSKAVESFWAVPNDKFHSIWDKKWDEARRVVMDATLALIAWDECGHLLDTKSEYVKSISLLGHYPAQLLLPAVIAFEKSKSKGDK